MKRLPPLLAVDASILVAAIRGRGPDLIKTVAAVVSLVTNDRIVDEVRRRVTLGMQQPQLLERLDLMLPYISVVSSEDFSSVLLLQAATALQLSVQSRNGSTKDAPLLALAWAAEADIWSTDRDFAGTGTASWSTPNLLRAIELAESAKA